MTRRFAVIGQRASASGDFLLDDVPGTSGRLDVGLRCLRAAMLVSHGLRRDAVVYLVLGGGPLAPRTLRIRGDEVRFLRPDERAMAVLVKKALSAPVDEAAEGFAPVKPGVAVARGGLPVVLADAAGAEVVVLDEQGVDLREAMPTSRDVLFVLGDPGGIEAGARAALEAAGARAVSVGPVSLHAEDVVTVVNNEMDRRG